MYNILTSISLPICAFLFTILIIIMHMSKNKYKNKEYTLFSVLLFLNILVIFGEVLFVVCLAIGDEIKLIDKVACKLNLIFIIIWLYYFMYYLMIQFARNLQKNSDKLIKASGFIFVILAIITSIFIVLLKIEFYDYANSLYIFGGNVLYPVFVVGILSLIQFTCGVFSKAFSLNRKQKIPLLILLLILILLSLIVIVSDKSYNIHSFMFILILFVLYFALENQDNLILKMHDEQRKKAEEANEEKTEFLTSMSHAMRNPLNAIVGFSDAILKEGVHDLNSIKNDINDIYFSSYKLLNLINCILDLSNIETQNEKVKSFNFNFKSFITNIVSIVNYNIDSNKIKFNIIVDEDIPSVFYGDYSKVSKIILNLILSIIDVTKEGSINLNIKNYENNGNYYLYFYINSNGSVIDEDDYKYYSLTSDDTNLNNYSLIALYLVKLYSKMLNASVNMVSKDINNLAYSVLINLSIVDKNPSGKIDCSLVLDKTINNYQDKKILIVDNDLINIKLLSQSLSLYSFNIDSCTNKIKCLDKVKSIEYDLIFVNNQLLSGNDNILSEILDAKLGNPHIVILTSDMYSRVSNNSNEQYDYVFLPLDLFELNKIIIENLK